MKLFAIYVGGNIKGANIELHDMRFVAAPTIEETHNELRRQWWGTPSSLHIDCWAELTHADGYRISLKSEPAPESPKLYYVNLGGYDRNEFTEAHKNVFVVAETESKSKVRALKTVRHWDACHKDDMYEAEKSFALDKAAADARLYIHLEKIEDASQPPFVCRCKNIGRKLSL